MNEPAEQPRPQTRPASPSRTRHQNNNDGGGSTGSERALRGRRIRKTLPPAPVLAVALVAALAACFAVWPGEREPVVSRVDQVLERGKLVVLTRNGASSYFTDASGETGPEYELARAFARHLGVDIEVRLAGAFTDLATQLAAGDGDLIAAHLTATRDRQRTFRLGPEYARTRTWVVYRRGLERPRSTDDLKQLRGAVLGGSSYEVLLEQAIGAHRVAERQHEQEPERKHAYERGGSGWHGAPAGSLEDLLLAVDEGRIDYTLADERIFRVNAQFYPQVKKAFVIADEQPLHWAFVRDDDDSLVQQAEEFMRRAREDGTLASIHERFFEPRRQLDQVGMMRFIERMRERLPPWLPLFQEVAEEVALDWRLLVAVGYQESHWDHEAVSPTGVRGLMMLTRSTARQLGLDDRRDPLQSIRGGARYLLYLKDRLPDRIAEPDRTWMALAAYNMGLGHLEDARRLTQAQGADPDRWSDVSQRLPLLAQEQHHRHTRHGYAAGHVAQLYVRNIQRFYDTLVWMDTRSHPLLAANFFAAP